jgi:hypothetical protein
MQAQSADDRAQTAQDFVLGLGVFLFAIAFVFGFFPTLTEPYESGVGAAETSVGNRVAENVLNEVGAPDSTNAVNGTAAAEYFARNLSEPYIDENLSLSERIAINVTVRTMARDDVIEVPNASGTPVNLTAGDDYRNQSAVTVSRVVTFVDDDDCNPCRLLVRVWNP